MQNIVDKNTIRNLLIRRLKIANVTILPFSLLNWKWEGTVH